MRSKKKSITTVITTMIIRTIMIRTRMTTGTTKATHERFESNQRRWSFSMKENESSSGNNRPMDAKTALDCVQALDRIEAINSLEIQKFRLMLQQRRKSRQTESDGRAPDFVIQSRRAA